MSASAMPESALSESSARWRTIADRLGSRWCCSWQVALAMIVLGLFVTTGWGTTRGGLPLAQYFAVEFLADAAGGVVLLLAAVTVMRRRHTQTVPLAVVIVVWIAIGFVRGIVLSRFYPLDAAQVASATATLTAWALLLIYLAATFSEERERAARLQAANAELRAVRGSMQDVLEEERSRLIDAVRQAVSPEIARLRALVTVLDRPVGTGEITALADRVSAYSTGVIRQTSRELRGEESLPARRAADSAATVRPERLWLSYATAKQPVVIPMALITLRAVSVWASQTDITAALEGMVGLLIVAALALLGRRVLDRLLPRPSWSEMVASTLLILAMAGALTGIFHWARSGASGPTYVPLGLIFAFVLAVLVAARLVVGLEQRWAQETEELRSVNAELEQANADLRIELHVVRDQLAGILHGPVQGRLAAASMALRMYVAAEESGAPRDLASTVRTATTLLDRAQADIEQIGRVDDPDELSLSTGVEHISRTWHGLLEIDFVQEDRWPRPPDFTRGCVDVIGELVTNASRHGDARRVSIAYRGLDETRVRIEVRDDGSGPASQVEEGQGLGAVRRWGGDWRIERLPTGGARVTVTLAH